MKLRAGVLQKNRLQIAEKFERLLSFYSNGY